MDNAVLAYVLSALGLIASMGASVVKGRRMKLILFLVAFGNVMFAISYLVDGTGLGGAVPSLLGAVCAVVSYFLDPKDRPAAGKTRRLMVLCYGAAFVVVNLAAYALEFIPLSAPGGIHGLICLILRLLNAMCFVISIAQPNGAKFRFWVTANLVCISAYDFVAYSYSNFAAHAIQLLVNLIGVYLHDRKKP